MDTFQAALDGLARARVRSSRSVPLRLVVLAPSRAPAAPPPSAAALPNLHQALAELAHHVVAHPLWGVAIAVRVAAEALERAAERLHASTARAAWPGADEPA